MTHQRETEVRCVIGLGVQNIDECLAYMHTVDPSKIFSDKAREVCNHTALRIQLKRFATFCFGVST